MKHVEDDNINTYRSFYISFRAVVDHSEGKDLPSVSIESFEYFPGRGLIATLNGIEVFFFLTSIDLFFYKFPALKMKCFAHFLIQYDPILFCNLYLLPLFDVLAIF